MVIISIVLLIIIVILTFGGSGIIQVIIPQSDIDMISKVWDGCVWVVIFIVVMGSLLLAWSGAKI